MRTYLLYLTLSLAITTLQGQVTRGQQLPEGLIETFDTDYPEADETEWSRNGAKYSALFLLNEFRMEAVYDQVGEWQYTDVFLPETEIPEKIASHFRAFYANSGYSLKEALFHDAPSESFYILKIQKGSQAQSLRFTEEGDLLE
ncbi:PepSY-like domain-containing protein [Pontibacter sp. G13]|uniref:PepSY-like domain-containing protein n=1 Tax=Pontibacter sp. G13 TaxID=3074898 RepID=UPI00288ADF9B|nr:PepSY-like domain-containing protein [Pontibacter sp. G13]WNJ20990.1 PepSY-like domain-containing protein [Pontibacter sp. G13]